MELGRVTCKERDVADLLTLYGVTDHEERVALLALAQEASASEWWRQFRDVLPNWFQPYLGLEVAAASVHTFSPQVIPGLLQTADYARAVLRQVLPEASPEALTRMVSVRVARQRVLTRSDPLQLWAVLDEAALRRPVGGAKVMRGQLDSLVAASELPNVTLRILPFNGGAHPALGGAFTILRFADEDLSDVVYLEHLTGGQVLDRPDDVARYAVAMRRLNEAALPPERTGEVLSGVLSDLEPPVAERRRDALDRPFGVEPAT
jgi:hypothetical protein